MNNKFLALCITLSQTILAQYYNHPDFTKAIKNLKKDYNWSEFGIKTLQKDKKGYTNAHIRECDDEFTGCFFAGPLGSSYCGCGIKYASAELKFQKIPPVVHSCDSSCTLAKDTIVSVSNHASGTLTFATEILQHIGITLNYSLDENISVSLHSSMTQNKGDECVVLGGYFYWEINADIEKLCSWRKITGTECYAASSYNPIGGNWSGHKSFWVPIKGSDFANCYDTKKLNKIESYTEETFDIKHLINDDVMAQANKNTDILTFY